MALVTGGSRGLGRHTCEHLAARGLEIILTCRHRREEAEQRVSSLQAMGRQAAVQPPDAVDPASSSGFAAAFQARLAAFGARHFDVLVNNAGIAHHAAITEEDLDALYRVHFKAVYLLTQSRLPVLRDGGHIVNLSSGLTRIIYPGSRAYAAMKGTSRSSAAIRSGSWANGACGSLSWRQGPSRPTSAQASCATTPS